ncbi:MAG: LuxR C-terminal-related transcriptional regulator [Burkholderiales bacterium]|nr:LuxR C-terminal-related transcriptional regulator [Burkholderiales bacterium]
MAVSAMQDGAVSFLEKLVDADDLIATLEKALDLDAKRREKLQANLNLRMRFNTPTPKEKEVAAEIAKGGSNKDVGIRLDIAEKTVQIHGTSIYKKLRVHSQLEIAELLKKIGQI